jgi:hypothetical protein
MSALRLRRIRFKDGRTIEVLRAKHEDVAAKLRKAVELAIDDDPAGIVAYALVSWRSDGTVFPAFHNGSRSTIQAGQIPQYCKDVLLAEVAARWSKDD